MHYVKYIGLLFLVLLPGWGRLVYANHLLGGEINYTYIGNTGNGETYRVRLSFFGDCSSATQQNSAFGALINADPFVKLYDGDKLEHSLYLDYNTAESDIEITPVCPDEAANTACKNVNNPIPGIKKYVYEGDFVLPGKSSKWRFTFEGRVSSGTIAGRSFIIQNAENTDRSTNDATIMFLEATLNNLQGTNNSTAFTAVPSPFFCVNKASTYNLGAADVENDSLAFSLIPGKKVIRVNTPPVSDVIYITPYTAQRPIPAAAGNFNFDGQNGQMTFVPNLVMNCLVTNLVEEYRNGIKVGSSMREMTFVILDNCNNDAALDIVSNVKNASMSTDAGGNVTLSICEGQLEDLTFDIDCSDPNGDNTTVTYNSLPKGAVININNNGSQTPVARFTWNVTDVEPGHYIFYLNYTDDGCPLVATRTVAYTIIVTPHSYKFLPGSAPACTNARSGKAWVVPELQRGLSYYYKWLDDGGNTLRQNTSVTGDTLFNIPAGRYKVYLHNTEGCGTRFEVEVGEAPFPKLALNEDTVLCKGMQILLATEPEEHVTYVWNNGMEGCCITVDSSGVYSLTATNSCGSISDEVTLKFIHCSFCLFVPNAFSPNGDGQNDIFKILETCILIRYKLQIFNRWGEVVFSSFSTSDSWDGTIGGKHADAGTYFYYIEAEATDSKVEKFQMKGDLALIR